MSRKTRTHMPSGPLNESPADIVAEAKFRPSRLNKEAFGRRLNSLMVKKGWNQSDLARYAGLTRSSTSEYIRGHSFPTPESLAALARTLGITEEELLPNQVLDAIEEDPPAFEMKVSAHNHAVCWLRVEQLVLTSTALKIAELLGNDNAVERVRSGGAPEVQSNEG